VGIHTREVISSAYKNERTVRCHLLGDKILFDRYMVKIAPVLINMI